MGELLLRIAEQRLTGRLLLTSDLGERTIYVHSGYAVFAHSSQFSERLGAIGVRYGFLKREDVASALTLAREKSCEIGRAFLELGHLNGTQLFRLLGAQLVEQLAASCGPSPMRARFLANPDAADKVAILRVHPMTAVLSAVRHLPSNEHAKMLSAVAERRVAKRPLPEPAKQWLLDIGYLGDPETLASGEGTTVAALRSRLIAKLRASTQQDFDPTASPIPLDVRKEDSGRPAARSVADYLTLALLVSGAVKLADEPPSSERASAEQPQNAADGLRVSLGSALRSPIAEVPGMPSSEPRPVDIAIRAYLEDKREARTAARLAIWGPAAEVADDDNLEQTLTLYLTLKPESSDLLVLDVLPKDSPDKIRAAHAKYRAFLHKLSESLTSPLGQARLAELEMRVDDALNNLIPQPSAATNAPAPIREPLHANAEASRPRSVPPDGLRTSLPPEIDAEGLLRNIEARVREGNWQKVVELVESAASKGRALPPTLSLARALAQRELTPKPAARARGRIVVALLVGLACGWALARSGLIPFTLF